MTFSHSLRTRIVVSFALFGAVLGITYAVGIYVSMDRIDDHLINNRLLDEMNHMAKYYSRYHQLPTPASSFMTAHIGVKAMPLFLQDIIKGRGEGFHEVMSGNTEYHVAIGKLQNVEKPLYLFYEVSSAEFTEGRKPLIALVLGVGVGVIILLGLWIGWLTSRRVVAPVVHLAEKVNTSDLYKLPKDLSKDFFDDEVGVLARALEEAMVRVEAFVQREQQFSRDASHELRTPVSVIKGAAELLKEKIYDPKPSISRPLARIDRSVANMENIIEALLELSRENVSSLEPAPLELSPLVREIMNETRPFLKGKTVGLELLVKGDPQPCVTPPVFSIMLTNILRNAAQHTAEGKITVTLFDDRVVVADTGSGIPRENLGNVTHPLIRDNGSRGFGLGLSIVKRFCDRFNWNLEISSHVDQGTSIQIIFHQNPA